MRAVSNDGENRSDVYQFRFTFETVERVIQQTCSNLTELAARTRLRADTTLAMMADHEFISRQEALKLAAADETKTNCGH